MTASRSRSSAPPSTPVLITRWGWPEVATLGIVCGLVTALVSRDIPVWEAAKVALVVFVAVSTPRALRSLRTLLTAGHLSGYAGTGGHGDEGVVDLGDRRR